MAALRVTGAAPIAVVHGVALSPVSEHAEFSLSRELGWYPSKTGRERPIPMK
jgi:hypothetical protein